MTTESICDRSGVFYSRSQLSMGVMRNNPILPTSCKIDLNIDVPIYTEVYIAHQYTMYVHMVLDTRPVID